MRLFSTLFTAYSFTLVEITPLLHTVQGNLGVRVFGGPGLICTSRLWMIILKKQNALYVGFQNDLRRMSTEVPLTISKLTNYAGKLSKSNVSRMYCCRMNYN